jgi:hypothetical protein
VSFDPYGHLVPSVFRKEIEEKGLDIRPSIAVTRAHMKMSEIDEAARRGEIEVDGKIVLKSRPLDNVDGSLSEAYSGVEINISKAAVEPVWYLPGVAERFGMYVSEFHLVNWLLMNMVVDLRACSDVPCLRWGDVS